jgi:3-oxoacyl-[acyl-carrier protein] reductase
MRVALVTGGASGLGLATARRFASEGMRVVIADLNETAAAEAAASLYGDGHRALHIDIAEESVVAKAFDEVEEGVGPVAVLANFAGAIRAAAGDYSLSHLTLAEWDKLFAINARGSFLCCREMARRRPTRPVEHGRIILISSSAAQLGASTRANVAYRASKASVLALTKGAASELAPLGITVNAIAPGAIDTPMLRAGTAAHGGKLSDYAALGGDRLPITRLGLPEEVAAAASYLASPEAAYVTGATLDVNGGLRMQ